MVIGVEEQSYFFLALILLLGFENNIKQNKSFNKIFDFFKSNIFILICISLSIIAYFISIENFGYIKSYYLPFGRFWEIAVGWITWKITSSKTKIV